MPDVVNIGKRASDVRKSGIQPPYTKVIINVEKIDGSEDSLISYVAGDDTGVTLELNCPWGTQQMANDILAKINGYQYQPYDVKMAIIDPAVEMGDAVQTNGVYGGVYKRDSTFGRTFYSDFSAPQEEQLDHEYTYKSPVEKRISRQQALTQAMFQIQHDNIEARVTQKGGDIEAESFSWRLLSNEFGLYSGTKKVFTCNKNGIIVDGEIRARSGYIGTDANGFVINSKNIHNGMTAYNDTTHNGVYLGTDGIGLGQGKFTVTPQGYLTAKSGKIGSDASAWNIGAKSIYNGLSTLSGTDAGTYVGTDGIAVYKDNKNSFKVQQSNGRLTVLSGMTSRDDTTNTTGMYIGYDGIALGGGKFKVTNGGSLTAKEGYIGNGSSGFTIGSSSIYNGMTSYSDETNNGVYIGTNGIALGKGNFKVDSSGNLTAKSGTFDGTIYAQRLSFTNSDGSSTTTINGSNLTSGTVSKGKTTSGVQTSLDNGDDAKANLESLITGSLHATYLYTIKLTVDNGFYLMQRNTTYKGSRDSITVVTGVDFENKTVTTETINYMKLAI